MRKKWIAMAAAVLMVSFGAIVSAAQAPQGVGSEKAQQSSRTPRSYNPIKWIKKDQSATSDKSKKTKNDKTSATPATQEAPAPAPKG